MENADQNTMRFHIMKVIMGYRITKSDNPVSL